MYRIAKRNIIVVLSILWCSTSFSQQDSLEIKYRNKQYFRNSYSYHTWPSFTIEVFDRDSNSFRYDSIIKYESTAKHNIKKVLYLNKNGKICIKGKEKGIWDDPGYTKRKSMGFIYHPSGTWKYYDQNGKIVVKKKYKPRKKKKPYRNR
ncbi:MAG TPA: hypothetical protein VGF30_12115 [Bacteroidia bacterium]